MPAKKPSKSSVKKPVRKPAERGNKVPSIEDHEQRISKLEDGQPQLGALIEQVRSELRAVADGQVMLHDTLHQEMGEIRERLERLERPGQLELLEQGQAALQSELAQLTVIVRHLADDQVEMHGQLTQLTSSVTEVKGELSEVKREVSEVKREVGEVKGAIREQTERMESGEQRLQRLEAGGHG